jgi:hypothetical protein
MPLREARASVPAVQQARFAPRVARPVMGMRMPVVLAGSPAGLTKFAARNFRHRFFSPTREGCGRP